MVKKADVYIIFGASGRNDGGNIYGILASLEAAQEKAKILKKNRPFECFTIEKHCVYDRGE